VWRGLQESAAKAVLDAQRAAQRAAQRESRVLSAKEIRDVADSVLNPPAAAAGAAPAKASSPFGSLFGGPAKKVFPS
jgi:hypothetical protein